MWKKGFSLILVFLLNLSVFATSAAWFSPLYSGEQFEYKENSELFALSNSFPLSSVVEVTNKENGKSTVVIVLDKIKSTLLDRDILLSSKAIDELDAYGKGVLDVSIRLIWAPEEKDESVQDTGWYMYTTPTFDSFSNAYTVYSRLQANGFKPIVNEVEQNIVISIPYIRSFEKDSSMRRINLSGLESATLEMMEDPFIKE